MVPQPKVLDWTNTVFDMLAAIMISINTFLNFGGHAEKCRNRKIELDALVRTIEESETYTDENGVTPQQWIHEINKQYSQIQQTITP